MLTTRFTELVGCTVPIQSAPMGGVATAPSLPGAVSEAGGHGMVAGISLPSEALSAVLDEVENRTQQPYGVNFLMPFLEDRGVVEVAASRAGLVDFFYGDPDPSLVELVHRGGALAGWQVGSTEEARAAGDAGCDVVVAQGVEAGGHVRGRLALLPLLSEVLDAVDVPVVAAGGIATARSVAAVLAAGADAARVGTRFIASTDAAEDGAHPTWVDTLLRARGEDAELTEAFSVMWPNAPHRVLRSALESAESLEDEVIGETVMVGTVMPIPRLSVISPSPQTTGAIEAMCLYAGQSAGAVREIKPAAEIVRELAEGAAALLSARR
jgi:nitronate monooxygenase